MASWEREGRYGREEEREEELLRRGRPSPGKRSLTHSSGTGFAELPPPGKVPATLNVTDEGVAPDAAVRTRVEATTGADLSSARVHTGDGSQESAAALRARAFTVGSDIHFASGQYQPGTAAGDHLLAHELVHTVQQGSGPPSAQLKSSEVSQEGDAAEVEADRIAGAAMSGSGERIAPVARAAPIARTPESLTGNPAERTDPTGAVLTRHRSIGVGDAANAPTVTAAGSEARATNVRPKVTETAPLHFNGAACPLDSAIYEEDTTAASPPPAGFSAVTGFSGTTAAPMVTQQADPAIYIAGHPTMEDVQQGGIGDCYFMAALISIVGRDPGKITGMTAADGRGGATVTFWRTQAHTATLRERVFGGAPRRDWIQVAVTVTDDLAVNITDNRVHGAQVRCAPQPKSQDYWAAVVPPNLEIHRKDTFELARWAPLMEKAYARFSQTHGQYGGADARGQSGGSGYNDINSGFGLEVFYPFYGPAMDDPANRPGFAVTAYTPGAPGNSIVAANATVMEHLILLQGRGSEAASGDTNAPVITALTSVDAMIGRLGAAIPIAQADADYVNVDAARQATVTTVATNIAAWQALLPVPAAGPTPAQTTAKQAIGTACGTAITPGIDESANQQKALRDYFRAWASPIQFGHDDDVVPADKVNAMHSLGGNLRIVKTPPVQVEIHGYSSTEGDAAYNQDLSQRRVDHVETEITTGGAIAPHTTSKVAHGEVGAGQTGDPAWRKVDFTITTNEHHTNSLLDPARSQNIRDMAGLMLDLRNIGTDNSPGQRNVYGDHAYAVIAVNIVTTTGVMVPLSSVPASSRASLYPLVDPDVSTVTLRNPHHGNEPDRTDSNRPARAGDGDPSGAGSDGVFNVTLRDFFRDFNSINSGVFPRS